MPPISTEVKTKLFRTMHLIRFVEERIADLYSEWEMRCPVHLSSGQEAAAAGTGAALRPGDQAISGHRSHGHYLAKGGDLKAMMAEIYGKATGCAGGKGGSMHLIDRDAGFLGSAPIIGSTIAIGVGAALSAHILREDRVVMIYFGDGAVETGVFYESLNFAALKKLPAIFVCENNLYSVYSPMSVRQPERPISGLAASHGIEAHVADGNDAETVYGLSRDAVEKARNNGGPTFLEFQTYRYREHCGPNYDNDIGYRSELEYETWRGRDPIAAYRQSLLINHVLTEHEVREIEAQISAEMEAAVLFAKQSPFPTLMDSATNLYAE